jgi:hypothetical protein
MGFLFEFKFEFSEKGEGSFAGNSEGFSPDYFGQGKHYLNLGYGVCICMLA